MSPDDPRHGMVRGYRLHRVDHEPACTPCANAWYRYNKRATYLRATGNALQVPALGTHRRIRALMALGYGLPVLAEHLNIATGNLSTKMQQPYVVRRTHEAVADLFERLSMAPPPEDWVAQRTRNIARKRGWAPPLAWDDIDTDLEPQWTGEPCLDHVAIQRVIDGGTADLSRNEQREAARRLAEAGVSDTQIGKRLHLTDRTILRWRHEMGVESHVEQIEWRPRKGVAS